jgi:D-glycero-alpha-D-manno-heptose-7-phosphate kinase
VRIECSAPTRIDLAGGTYDIWPLYLLHEHAQTINAAISLRAHATIASLDGDRVAIVSEDTGERVEAEHPSALTFDRLPLLARLVRHFNTGGLELRTRSGSPIGAGIGGSSAMNVAVAAGLAAWTEQPLGVDQLLTLTMNLEAQVIGVPTGVQDYRPAYFGGVSAVELGVSAVRRVALNVDPDELGQRIVLAYTGASRNSGINNWEVMQRRIAGEPSVVQAFDGIRDAAAGIREALQRRDWASVGAHLAHEWTHRKRLASGVTTPAIDAMFAAAAAAGAKAGKVCGAGGGGCLFCLVDPAHKADVANALSARGARVLPVSIEREGVVLTRS